MENSPKFLDTLSPENDVSVSKKIKNCLLVNHVSKKEQKSHV